MLSGLRSTLVIVQAGTRNTFESGLRLSTPNSKGRIWVRLSVFRRSIYRLRAWAGAEENGE